MRFLCVLCVLCGSSFFAAALNREAFTITKYDLEIRLEPEQQRLGARGKIMLRNDSSAPQKVAALQISSSLKWRALRVKGKDDQFVSQTYTSDIDHTGALSEAIITLPSAINPKDSVELEIGYEGVIPPDATRLARVGVPAEIARHTSWDHIGVSFTAVRGAGYVTWYPITTESADFSQGNSLFEVADRWKSRESGSEFRVKLTSQGDSGAAAPILLCGSEASKLAKDGDPEISVECTWSSLGTATPTFALAEYVDDSRLPLRLFSLRGHEIGSGKYSSALDPATKFVPDWFGKPSAPVTIADRVDPRAAPFESGTLLLVSMDGEDTKL